MCDDESGNSKYKNLKARIATINLDIDGNERTLSEIMYTASETGLTENMSSVDAIIIWKLVELARSLGDSCPDDLRM